MIGAFVIPGILDIRVAMHGFPVADWKSLKLHPSFWDHSLLVRDRYNVFC